MVQTTSIHEPSHQASSRPPIQMHECSTSDPPRPLDRSVGKKCRIKVAKQLQPFLGFLVSRLFWNGAANKKLNWIGSSILKQQLALKTVQDSPKPPKQPTGRTKTPKTKNTPPFYRKLRLWVNDSLRLKNRMLYSARSLFCDKVVKSLQGKRCNWGLKHPFTKCKRVPFSVGAFNISSRLL